MTHLSSLPGNATLVDLFKAFPETSRPLITFHEVLLRGPSPFSDAERELIATHVSALNGCRYCHGIHAATTERLGLPRSVIDGLAGDLEASDVPERMRPVLRYAEKLTRRPDSLTAADAEAVFAAGWNDTALYHTVAVTALFNLMNRLVEGLGIELADSHVDTASKRLAERGYLPLLDMLDR